MKRRGRGWQGMLAAAVGAALAGLAQAATPATVSELVFKAATYHGQEVVVTGEARDIRTKASKAGKDYTTFTLQEAGKKRWVRVFAWGKPSLYEGRTVVVTGTFSAEKKVGEYLFKKEIEAKTIR